MNVIKARYQDIPEISLLRQKAIREINARDYDEKVIDTLLKKNDIFGTTMRYEKGEIFCLVDNNQIIGTIALDGNKITGLYVHPDKNGYGYGKRLVTFIERYAKKKQIQKLILYSSLTAQGFYEKLDYRLIKKNIWATSEFEVPVPVMEKTLL
jgi:N-acetylglutamate synthase-like GNAT family acetyltransferase